MHADDVNKLLGLAEIDSASSIIKWLKPSSVVKFSWAFRDTHWKFVESNPVWFFARVFPNRQWTNLNLSWQYCLLCSMLTSWRTWSDRISITSLRTICLIVCFSYKPLWSSRERKHCYCCLSLSLSRFYQELPLVTLMAIGLFVSPAKWTCVLDFVPFVSIFIYN